MNNKTVSIIIPAFNSESYIRDALDSVLNQTYENLEIIVVDDGSTDKTGDVAEHYAARDQRVHVIHQGNNGPSHARNTGIITSTGEYLFFLDADDWIEASCIQRMVDYQQTYSADIVYFSHIREYQKKSEKYCVHKRKRIYEKEGTQEFFLYDMRMVTPWGKLYTRKVIGSTLYDVNMRTAEDVDFNFRIYENVQKAVYVPDCLLHYRILPKSAIHGYDPEILEKFTYTVPVIRERLSLDETCQKEAYFSFAAIAYIVVCRNGIALNGKLSFREKMEKIRQLNLIDWIRELFANVKHVRIPITRKALIFFGKFNLDACVLAAIYYKQGLDAGK